jgi:23S rRNA (guanosine2251-2'-O)-methyltransferase
MKEWITGRNPVFEVLKAGKRNLFQLLLSDSLEEDGKVAEIIQLAGSHNLRAERVPRQQLDRLSQNHQGVALQSSGYAYSSFTEILEHITSPDRSPFLLLLDTLQDPQNLGTLLRTAEIVGVHGVLLPQRKTATITPAVVNASSGACEHLKIAQFNLAQAIVRLKQVGVWVVGLESSRDAQLPGQLSLDIGIALVVGSEGTGMRPLVRRSCDLLMRLPMRGRIASLNASVAGSVALYFVWQARGYEGEEFPQNTIDG